MGYGIHANPEEFERGYNFCVSQRATGSLALIFAKKFSDRGHVDFAEGCSHYALCVMVARCNNTKLFQMSKIKGEMVGHIGFEPVRPVFYPLCALLYGHQNKSAPHLHLCRE